MSENGALALEPPEDQFLVDMIKAPTAQLFIDHRYQRGVRKSRVRDLVEHWSWKRYIPIIVVHRKEGDRYAVVDGQQRLMAAQELGIPYLPAVLIVARDVEDEAERFVGANSASPVGAGERFRAEYLRYDPRCLAIVEQVKACGFRLNCILPERTSSADAYTIDAVAAVERLYDQGYLVRVLRTVGQIWGAQPHRDMTQGPFLSGVYLCLKHLDRFEVSQEDLVLSLYGQSVQQVVDQGYERYKSMVTSRSISGGIAAVLVDRYNYRKHANKAVPPYDRSGARATRGFHNNRTQMANGNLAPRSSEGSGRYVKRVI